MEIRKAPNDTAALSFVANSEAARYVFVVVAAADVMDRGRRYDTFVLAWGPEADLAVVEQIQRKTRVRDRTPQNAPRTRPDVEKEDQKAELKKNQTCRRYVEKTSIFFQTTGRHPPGARRETTEVKTRKF